MKGTEVTVTSDAEAFKAACRASKLSDPEKRLNKVGKTARVLEVDTSDSTVKVKVGDQEGWVPVAALEGASELKRYKKTSATVVKVSKSDSDGVWCHKRSKRCSTICVI